MIETKTLDITQDILRIVAEIDEFKGAWRALETLAPDTRYNPHRSPRLATLGAVFLADSITAKPQPRQKGRTRKADLIQFAGIVTANSGSR